MNQLTLALLLLSAPAFSQSTNLYHLHSLREPALLQTYNSVLWDAFHHSERFWHDWTNDGRAGFWGSGRSDHMNEGVRAISEMVFTCAVLTRYSDAVSVSETDACKGRATAALRYVVASHLSGPQKCTDGKPWGGSWQSAMWTATMGFGAWLLWDDLDTELRQDVERVIASEANRFLAGRPPGGSFNDTKAEENGWNLICLSLAANMFPQNPHASAWNEKAIGYMINTLSAPQDRQDRTVVDGRPIKEWFSAENVHPDFTLENHGFFHPSYVACSSYFLTQSAMHYTYAHRRVPQAATHHLMDTWRMFQTFILPCGEAAYPQGMDWELHNLSFINLFASLATYQKDPLAARMEEVSLQYIRAWQNMCGGDMALPGSTLGFTRHAICAEQAAYGLLAHKLFGVPAKELSAAKAASAVEGMHQYDYAQFITHRTKDKFVSFSWTNRIMGMLIPIGQGHEGNPHFTVPIRDGIVGSFELSPRGDTKTVPLSHECKKTSNGFETTGTLLLNGGRLSQRLRLVSIGEKTVVYEDRVTALTNVTVVQEHGVPVGIEKDALTGGTRLISHAQGRVACDWQHPRPTFSVPGSWVNVDGRLGMVTVSGAGLAYVPATKYTPGISVYSDLLYGSYSAAPRQIKAGDQIAHRIAVFYLEVSADETASLAKAIHLETATKGQRLRFKLPESSGFAVVWLQ